MIWNGILVYSDLVPIIILNLPVLIGSIVLFIQGRNENLNLQRFAKILLFTALGKAFLIIGTFIFCVWITLSSVNNESRRFAEFITIFVGINAAIDLVTAYFCLIILRRTNEYMNLISRKAFFEFRHIIDGGGQV